MAATLRPKFQILRFGSFELDRGTGELRKDGRLIHLRHQPVQVLLLLLEKAGSLVTRHEITCALWPDDLDVDVEQGLNHCMKEIRVALGDRTDSPRFVQTLPRRGYRFMAEVRHDRPAPAYEAIEIDEASRVERAPESVPRAEPSTAEADRRDSRVRVRVLLTRPQGEEVIWSQTYDRPPNEADGLERDVILGLRTGLQVALAAKNEDADACHEAGAPRRDQRFE